KQVFVTTGKPDYFVWKNRSGNDDLIVIKDSPIDVDGHIHRKQTAAEIFDLFCGNGADVFQGYGVIPLVIKKAHRPVFCAAFLHRNFQAVANSLLTHWLMRAERNHDVERRRAGTDLSEYAFKEHSQRTRSRAIGDDQEHFFPAIF